MSEDERVFPEERIKTLTPTAKGVWFGYLGALAFTGITQQLQDIFVRMSHPCHANSPFCGQCSGPVFRGEGHYKKIQERRLGPAPTPRAADRAPDFVLRGAVACACCGVPYRSAWSQGRSKKYPYYVCQTKDCDRYGKSVARDKVEGAFAEFLKTLEPSQSVFSVAKLMFRDAWDQRAAHSASQQKILLNDLKKLEREKARLLDRIVKTENNIAATALEERLTTLDAQKCLLEEKASRPEHKSASYEEALEPALGFLANHWKIWEKGSHTLRRALLRLVLDGPFLYEQKTGPRTAKTTIPFKALGDFCDHFVGMVPLIGLEPTTPSLRMTCSTS